MPGIIALVLTAIVALAVLSFAVPLLFSPWLLVVAIAILAWIKFRPRRSHRQPGRLLTGRRGDFSAEGPAAHLTSGRCAMQHPVLDTGAR